MKALKMYAIFLFSMALFGTTTAAEMPPEKFGTPDNLPPPLENACDMTSGAAKGLCTAYCEAMDCDSDNPNANGKACARVGQRFEKLTGKVPPCERICPCWEESALENVTAENQLGFNSCPGIGLMDVIQNSAPAPGVEGGFAADPQGLTGQPACFTRDHPPFSLSVSEDEAQYCADQILKRCTEIGSSY